ncbi:NAD(P)-binding protein [Aspergillus coremiiformis]|uniref:NAD(P)-binding protein n=1 Tax=Aspergillus coremiiformis TaxID=138285 RepID=A0A5N6ZDZ9_9EURO|nr:NAD(P)-binding protein [Aspergillus coremiiformis]
MTVVAVAGGTGGLGRAIVETLRDLQKHEILVLTRKVNPIFEAEVGVRTVAVDYTSVDSLKTSLEDNKVHTVICTLNVMENGDPQLNCIQAADLSKSTKRFIPANFGVPHKNEHVIDSFPNAIIKRQANAALEKSSLEYTNIYNGLFMDYYGMPHIKSYLQPTSMAIDIPSRTAAIPGSGDVPLVLTYTFDVARFVGALLGQEKWDVESYVIGDRVTWNQLLQIAEEVTETKFNTTYDSVEKLKRGEMTLLPSHLPVRALFQDGQLETVLSAFGLWFNDGAYNLTADRTLNDTFPEIKTRKVRDFLQEAWGASK